MARIASKFNWHAALENARVEIDAIGNDFILLEKPVSLSVSSAPFITDVTTAILCLKGSTEGAINLKPFKSEAPCMIILLPDQILEQKYLSDDFSGLFIIMSKRFTDNLLPNVHERLPLFLAMQDSPCIPMNTEAIESMKTYFEMLKRIIRIKEHPHRLEVAKYLTLTFFYGIGYSIHPKSENKEKTHNELLVERFLDLVRENYKEQRLLGFYADKLCITPKHLSKVVKKTSHKSPNDWIDDHVILEAKALFNSTNMTIQQVCDELNFDDQSFFRKYFKRHTGMPPREYKVKW